MKRFKITDPSERTSPSFHDTIKEVVNELNSKNRDTSLQTYWIECRIDDIEVTSDELLNAWNDGERPEDLQMF